jgi:predicted NAD/FAD-dependent oxidoreductase
MTITPKSITIIGAGMSGLMAAYSLAEQELCSTVLDKGRSVGGRLATRRIGPGRADHGAQFFTVRDSRFQRHVDRWLQDGLLFRWSTGWSNGSLDESAPDGYPRYAVNGGMNAMAKQLAGALADAGTTDIRTGVTVTGVAPYEEGWRIATADGADILTAAVLMTAPVPQSLALLDAGGTTLQSADRGSLESIEYAPCLCALALVEGEVALPEPGAVQRQEAPISWIADNQRKSISPDARIITLHAGPALSRQLFDATDQALQAAFTEALEVWLAPDASIKRLDLKRWRYALPTRLLTPRCLRADGLPPLVFAGDAFGGPRVEGAALSGMAAAGLLAGMVCA